MTAEQRTEPTPGPWRIANDDSTVWTVRAEGQIVSGVIASIRTDWMHEPQRIEQKANDGYVVTEGNRVEIVHHGGAYSMGLPREEVLANAHLIAHAFNAATTAEDMGYDGQAAVEALPELLGKLSGLTSILENLDGGYLAPNDIDNTDMHSARALLASCRAKESGT